MRLLLNDAYKYGGFPCSKVKKNTSPRCAATVSDAASVEYFTAERTGSSSNIQRDDKA